MFSLNFVWLYVPDIERNGHHGVENDDVSPEAKEASVAGGLIFAIEQIPGLGADSLIPVCVTNSQTRGHQDEQCKDLW